MAGMGEKWQQNPENVMKHAGWKFEYFIKPKYQGNVRGSIGLRKMHVVSLKQPPTYQIILLERTATM